jgi:hypothetical protein
VGAGGPGAGGVGRPGRWRLVTGRRRVTAVDAIRGTATAFTGYVWAASLVVDLLVPA